MYRQSVVPTAMVCVAMFIDINDFIQNNLDMILM